MYSTYKEGKSNAAERFIRSYFSLKNKIFKHMTAISKNVYFDVLDDVTADSYLKVPKFKVGDHVRISKYKNIFAKGYAPNSSEEVFVV